MIKLIGVSITTAGNVSPRSGNRFRRISLPRLQPPIIALYRTPPGRQGRVARIDYRLGADIMKAYIAVQLHDRN